jgi:hypothetical protein
MHGHFGYIYIYIYIYAASAGIVRLFSCIIRTRVRDFFLAFCDVVGVALPLFVIWEYICGMAVFDVYRFFMFPYTPQFLYLRTLEILAI